MLAFEKGTCNKFAVKKISKKTFSVGVRRVERGVEREGHVIRPGGTFPMVFSGGQSCQIT